MGPVTSGVQVHESLHVVRGGACSTDRRSHSCLRRTLCSTEQQRDTGWRGFHGGSLTTAVGPGTPGSPPGGAASRASVIPHHREKGLTGSYVKTRTALRKTAASKRDSPNHQHRRQGRGVILLRRCGACASLCPSQRPEGPGTCTLQTSPTVLLLLHAKAWFPEVVYGERRSPQRRDRREKRRPTGKRPPASGRS